MNKAAPGCKNLAFAALESGSVEHGIVGFAPLRR
jgi:hypothetical protein